MSSNYGLKRQIWRRIGKLRTWFEKNQNIYGHLWAAKANYATPENAPGHVRFAKREFRNLLNIFGTETQNLGNYVPPTDLKSKIEIRETYKPQKHKHGFNRRLESQKGTLVLKSTLRGVTGAPFWKTTMFCCRSVNNCRTNRKKIQQKKLLFVMALGHHPCGTLLLKTLLIDELLFRWFLHVWGHLIPFIGGCWITDGCRK